uniref:Uncharacterized protein n=1 Tax=Rhizophora mucronata TaxID=61149 RepID=A0A2P2P1H7_RHIMU
MTKLCSTQRKGRLDGERLFLSEASVSAPIRRDSKTHTVHKFRRSN